MRPRRGPRPGPGSRPWPQARLEPAAADDTTLPGKRVAFAREVSREMERRKWLLGPCTMCAGAAVLARVGCVVFGAYDEKAGAVGSQWGVVRERRLNHRPEVLAAESIALLEEFFAGHR